MLEYLATKDRNGILRVGYWACGLAGKAVEILGELKGTDVASYTFPGPGRWARPRAWRRPSGLRGVPAAAGEAGRAPGLRRLRDRRADPGRRRGEGGVGGDRPPHRPGTLAAHQLHPGGRGRQRERGTDGGHLSRGVSRRGPPVVPPHRRGDQPGGRAGGGAGRRDDDRGRRRDDLRRSGQRAEGLRRPPAGGAGVRRARGRRELRAGGERTALPPAAARRGTTTTKKTDETTTEAATRRDTRSSSSRSRTYTAPGTG